MQKVIQFLKNENVPFIYVYDVEKKNEDYSYSQNCIIASLLETKKWQDFFLYQLNKYEVCSEDSFLFHDLFGLSFIYFRFHNEKKIMLFGAWKTGNPCDSIVIDQEIMRKLSIFPKKNLEEVQVMNDKYVHLIKNSLYGASISEKVIEILLNDLSKIYTLEELSCILNYSESYIRYRFKLERGETFKKYYRKLKLSKAFELINNEGNSIADVTRMLGYQSVSTFSKAYYSYLQQ